LSAHKAVGSADLQYPRGLYDGRFSLPLGKFGSLFPVRIHASKPLPVLVKHSHLPVLVLSPPIFPKLGAFSCDFCFGHGLNISMMIRARKYQFGQYFARNRIILHYHVGCNDERHGTRNACGAAQESHSAQCGTFLARSSFAGQDTGTKCHVPEIPATHPTIILSPFVEGQINVSSYLEMVNCPFSWFLVAIVMQMNTITNLEFSLFPPRRLMNGGGTYNASGRVNDGKAAFPSIVWLLETLSTFNAAFKECFGKAFIL
jgi:hypothetical protein